MEFAGVCMGNKEHMEIQGSIKQEVALPGVFK